MSQAESVSGLTLSGLSLSGLSLEQRIQRWVQLDNQVKQINDAVRELRESRNNVESSILAHVADNNLSHATVRIKDGTLKFAFNVKQPPALTLAFLGEALAPSSALTPSATPCATPTSKFAPSPPTPSSTSALGTTPPSLPT